MRSHNQLIQIPKEHLASHGGHTPCHPHWTGAKQQKVISSQASGFFCNARTLKAFCNQYNRYRKQLR